MVQDFSKLNFSISGMQTFFKEQGIEFSPKDSQKLESIFKECDTKNEKGEKKADGVLTGEERSSFINKVKSSCPNIYQKVVDFFTVIDVQEDLEKMRQEAIDEVESDRQKQDIKDKQDSIKNPPFGLS